MSDHDLDPPSADGAHAHVAGALVDALDAPVPPGMLAAVQRRATRRHRRRAAATGAGVAAVLVAAVLAGPAVVPALDRERSVAAPSPSPRPPDGDAPAVPEPSDDASSPLLTQRQVAGVAPGAELAVRVSGQTPYPPIPDPGPSGGWCGSATLAGVETPPELWRALWTQPTSDAPVTRRTVGERLFRWEGEGAAASALAYVEATAGSATRCDPDAEPMPGPAYQVVPVTVPGAPGAVAAVAAAEGPETPWRVRVLTPVGDRGVVVDLDVVTVAGTARGALDLVVPLVAAAVQRAGAWEEQAPATVTIDDDGLLGLGADDRSLLLTDPELARLEPGARVGVAIRQEEPGQASARGGWCNNADLGGGPLVDLWTQSAAVARSPTAVDGSWLMDQKVLRWDGPADVSVALEAWGASTTDCVTGGPDYGGVQLVNTFQRRYAVVEAPIELGPGALVAVAPPGEEALGYLVNAAVPTGGSTLSAALVRVEATSSEDALRRAIPALIAATDAAGRTP